MRATAPIETDWKAPAGVAALIAAGSLAIAFISQYGFGLIPCELCVWQRWPYAVGLALAAAPVLAPERVSKLAVVLLLGGAALSFEIGAGLAVFHSGVEFQWWTGLQSCAGAAVDGESFQDFMSRMSDAPPPSCEARAPFFLGLTMANWNVFVSAGAAVLFAAAAALRWRAAA